MKFSRRNIFFPFVLGKTKDWNWKICGRIITEVIADLSVRKLLNRTASENNVEHSFHFHFNLVPFRLFRDPLLVYHGIISVKPLTRVLWWIFSNDLALSAPIELKLLEVLSRCSSSDFRLCWVHDAGNFPPEYKFAHFAHWFVQFNWWSTRLVLNNYVLR